ncbi:DUF1127 domain-containing protein [Rhodovulum euryhalinum]|uniref:Uncharacterized protein n=1 Tax=Rhodovulum euryhalinum TaxID=35805 RepID=A0A4V2SB60_9RHOB|nr:DUF1127 domain-containing protein [Rhodovulum euryhalinum]TCO74270.1 hypothetical protein EV655_101432 [Rhodovulum euryhalinum]
MTHTETTSESTEAPVQDRLAKLRGFWRGNIIESMAALHYRDQDAYNEWLEARDTVSITAALSRLSDRQLDRIGLNRETLVLAVEGMMEANTRNGAIFREALEIVEPSEARKERREMAHGVAAE